MRTLSGFLLMVSGVAACPCHLPLTLSVLAAIAGGTSVGTFLLGNTWLLVGVLGGYFVAALLVGFRLVTRPGPNRSARTACEEQAEDE